MNEIEFVKHQVFRETTDVIFYDISVKNNNATDLVEHAGPAVSPPDEYDGIKQFYICLLYTSPSPRDVEESRMPSSA